MYLNLGKPTLYTWRIVGLQCICGSVKKPWEKYNPAAAGLLDRHVYHTPIWAAEGWGQLPQQPLRFYRSELREWKIHIWLTFHVTTWSKIYSCDVHTLRTPWQNLSTQSIITAWSMFHYTGQQHHWQCKWESVRPPEAWEKLEDIGTEHSHWKAARKSLVSVVCVILDLPQSS